MSSGTWWSAGGRFSSDAGAIDATARSSSHARARCRCALHVPPHDRLGHRYVQASQWARHRAHPNCGRARPRQRFDAAFHQSLALAQQHIAIDANQIQLPAFLRHLRDHAHDVVTPPGHHAGAACLLRCPFGAGACGRNDTPETRAPLGAGALGAVHDVQGGIGISIEVGRLTVESTARSPTSPALRDGRRGARRLARGP